jgi:hypothetical protein
MSPATPQSTGTVLQKLIESSRQDLAKRLSVPVEEIVLLEAVGVTWPDSSLGCPQEGMAYAQVLIPGYLIRLQAGNAEFEYHAGKGSTVIYCENPVPPVPGMPGNT